PDYPGTVSWKIGYQLYRDQPVANNGTELSPALQDACEASSGRPAICSDGRRRFDSNRDGLFRWVLYAHARGTPKSTDKNSPQFHVPRSASGISDLPGGGSMVTLGLWDNFVGTDF